VPTINLVELDQLGDLLGTLSVPADTYTSAILTISANPGDVSLVVSADPETGFAGTPGATIPSSQIQIQGATGASGSKTVPVNVNFSAPLVINGGATTSVDVEFDLAHPAFLVGHVPPASGGTTIWAVNFNKGPVRHHPIYDITRLILRHMYGTVSTVSSDDSYITITKDYPVYPPTNPETEITSNQSLNILADATNGTLFYDWCPIKDELFLLSDVMVARSGHRTIGQCIDAGKPAVLVPIHNHSEQIGNAAKFQRLGLGIALPPEELCPESLTEAVDSCMRDPKYKKNLEVVQRVSMKYRGLEKCAEIIDSYA
jgi:hypothetical protein